MLNNSIGMISLGCAKNQVDFEIMLASLEKEGFEVVDYYSGADAVIINTCGFIDSAVQEAIESILEVTELKKDGVIGKIVVTGCMSQRYQEEILKDIPEVDAVIGIGANENIAEILKQVILGETVIDFPDVCRLPLEGERILTTPRHWAYLKIADGCSNCCAYCAIPSIRGEFRSREKENIIEEAEKLAAGGVKELILIAQDTTNYGADIYGRPALAELLSELCEISSLKWIRLLYCYPDKITDELLEVMAANEKIINYIDLPLQHINNEVLSAMNRNSTRETIYETIEKIRAKLEGAVIRTTFITGFPGESEEAFEELLEFVNEIEFDRLGCFEFSPQEGTPAHDMPNQIEGDIKARRTELIMQDQYEIVKVKNAERIGEKFTVVVEGYDDYSDSYFGRSYMDAPEVDGQILFTSSKLLENGEFIEVEIFGVSDYDLLGKAVD